MQRGDAPVDSIRLLEAVALGEHVDSGRVPRTEASSSSQIEPAHVTR